MKLLVLSELHVEFAVFSPEIEATSAADVVVPTGFGAHVSGRLRPTNSFNPQMGMNNQTPWPVDRIFLR